MIFDWDRAKAAANAKKHGVSFEEAASLFGDPLAYTFPDPAHSEGEERWLTFGMSSLRRVIVVAHIEFEQGIRIISAREATPHERRIHEEG